MTFEGKGGSTGLVGLALAVLGTACSGSSGDAIAVDDAVDPQLVGRLRGVIAQELILPIAPTPTFSPELLALGQALFFDKELSGNRDVSCATCHLPNEGGGDGRALPRGVGGVGLGPQRVAGAIVPRNSPTVLNAHLVDTLFWDGRVELRPNGTLVTPAGAALTPAMIAVFEPGLEALAAQAMFPPTSRDEMRGFAGENEIADVDDDEIAAIWEAVVARLTAIPEYVGLFADAYPGTAVDELSMAHVGNAIAAFEASAFHAVDSPFQAFLLGDDLALSNEELMGGLEFFGPIARCSQCHDGSTFTDERFHNIGMAQFGPGKGHGPLGEDDFGREGVSASPQDRYEFRTPPLLNVELTAPYGHAGQFSTLASMTGHYRNATQSLRDYSIAEHVDDPELLGTLVPNENDVLARLSNRVDDALPFDAASVTAFLRALTANSARDLSAIVPTSVPSGLSVDGSS
ncbi:MAG: cytochrome c peroxidase [Planctomycetota bacterium]